MLSIFLANILKPIHKLKVDNSNPPETPVKPKIFGSYCIRAESKLIDENTNTIDILIKGYDTKVDIMERVEKLCKSKMKARDGTYCTEAQMCFLGDVRNCDGHIMMFEKDKSWLIPPPFSL
tara:strand:- start:60 stop:422 length:363 start_codon:yes stop_codon:yes gene_type:complete